MLTSDDDEIPNGPGTSEFLGNIVGHCLINMNSEHQIWTGNVSVVLETLALVRPLFCTLRRALQQLYSKEVSHIKEATEMTSRRYFEYLVKT